MILFMYKSPIRFPDEIAIFLWSEFSLLFPSRRAFYFWSKRFIAANSEEERKRKRKWKEFIGKDGKKTEKDIRKERERERKVTEKKKKRQKNEKKKK